MPRPPLAAPLLLAVLAALALPAQARPLAYALDTETSVVGIETDFGPDTIRGQFPVKTADIAIDFQDLRQSHVAVSLDAAAAEASFPFAAQAMKGPKVLDTAQYPTIDFRSTTITADAKTAQIQGLLTIRGVTRPATMTARLTQTPGEVAGDYRQLTISLSCSVSRSAFGATGWADMVGDQVRIQILAAIQRSP